MPIILTSNHGGATTQLLFTMNLLSLHKPYRADALCQAIDIAVQPLAPGRRLPAMAGRG